MPAGYIFWLIMILVAIFGLFGWKTFGFVVQ